MPMLKPSLCNNVYFWIWNLKDAQVALVESDVNELLHWQVFTIGAGDESSAGLGNPSGHHDSPLYSSIQLTPLTHEAMQENVSSPTITHSFAQHTSYDIADPKESQATTKQSHQLLQSEDGRPRRNRFSFHMKEAADAWRGGMTTVLPEDRREKMQQQMRAISAQAWFTIYHLPAQ